MSTKTFDDFGSDFQKKIVQALFVDTSFAEQMVEVLDCNYFGLKYLRVVVSKYFSYYEKYSTFPSFSILITIIRDELESDGEDLVIKRQIFELLKSIKASPLNGDINYVKEKSLEFCKRQSLRNALLKSIEMIERSDYEGVVSTVKASIELGGEKNLGHEYHTQLASRMTVTEVSTVRTGFDVLDSANILNGGLAHGELGVIMAATGVGKCCTGTAKIDIEYEVIDVFDDFGNLIKTFNPWDIVETKNRGSIMAKDLTIIDKLF
jgi:replicative DNA helicase